MSKKISHTLVGGRTVAGTGGQGLKIGGEGRLYWMDVDESSLVYVAPVWYGSRGVFAGGNASSQTDRIEYFAIASTGNTTDFGNLTEVRAKSAGGASSGVRGCFAGGRPTGGAHSLNTIDYITIATTGNALDFGDLTDTFRIHEGLSDGSRGCFGGGTRAEDTNSDVIDYITISTTGNALDFGNLTNVTDVVGALSNSVRGVFVGGVGNVDLIQYITIATTGNASSFGDTSHSSFLKAAGSSDGTRAVYAQGTGGSSGGRQIEYITVATTGNATDFGVLTGSNARSTACCGDGIKSVWGGGYESTVGNSNVMDYVTIQTTGNAVDFGDLAEARDELTGVAGN